MENEVEDSLVYNPNRRRKKGNNSSTNNNKKNGSSSNLTQRSKQTNYSATQTQQINKTQPKDDCLICCEAIDYYPIGNSCLHSDVCYSCSIKSIVICAQTYCIICKVITQKNNYHNIKIFSIINIIIQI